MFMKLLFSKCLLCNCIWVSQGICKGQTRYYGYVGKKPKSIQICWFKDNGFGMTWKNGETQVNYGLTFKIML